MSIHPSALIDPAARLEEGVSVGPFTVIGAGVEIGAGSRIGSHCVIAGPTRIGRDNTIHAHASLGGQPQDKKHRGEPTRLEIGDGNTFFEFTTVSRGTVDGGGVTRVGSDIVTEQDGVTFKLAYNQIKEKERLLLCSSNPIYKPFYVAIADVREVWKFRLMMV